MTKPNVVFVSGFLSHEDADALLERIRSESDFRQNYYNYTGKTGPRPRMEAWYGSWDYPYSPGTVLKASPMPDCLQEVIDRIREASFGSKYKWVAGTHFTDEPEGRRTMELQWARNLRAACEASGTVFFFKQVTATRAGRGADALGRLYHEYPQAQFPRYSEEEFAADFLPKKKLIQIGGSL
jgi:hypothetical protein